MYVLSEEQKLFQRTIREFAEKELAPKAAHWDEKEEFPLENMKKAAKQGLLGLRVPEEYGGQGGSLMDACIAWEEISRVCANTALAVHVYDICNAILLEGGTGDQKKKYIPPLCKGERLMAISVVGPEGGSDLASMPVGAVLEGDEYVLNSQKMWTSLATVADAFQLLTKTKNGPCLFLIERDTPGLRIGAVNRFVGDTAIGNAVVYFENCRIPKENLIGKEGEGLNITWKALVPPSLFLVAMYGVGIARAAFEAAINYVKERRLYGAPMAKLQGVRWKIAEMALEIETARQLTFHGAGLFEQKSPTAAMIGSMVKWYATEMSVKVAKEAMQFHGGYGMTKEYPLQRYLRDALVLTIGEFPNDFHKSLVADALLG